MSSKVEQMSRGELMQRVEELEQQVEVLEEQVEKNSDKPNRQTLNLLLSSLLGVEVEDYTDDPLALRQDCADFAELIQTMNRRLNAVEEIAEEEETLTNDPNVSNWQRIVEDAQNLKDNRNHKLPNNRVKLYGDDIEQAVGCSNRHALNLIEKYGKNKRGADWQEHKRHTTSRKTESNDVQRKALIIDLEVWGDE